jgi:hypothetical protein
MGCEDVSASRFQYAQDTRVTGDRLVSDTGTSVFFENWNTNSGWYTNFTNPCSAFYAEDFNGTWKAWNHQGIAILDAYGHTASNNGKITGRLLNHETAYWYLNKLLLALEY